MQHSKTAIIFGASGLIGSYVLTELEADERYSNIIVYLRKPLKTQNSKVTEIITDFSALDIQVKGDEIYCCLGSTIRKAGSQQAFRKVDLDLPVALGKIAVKNGIGKMLVVSSLGADKNSGNFYLRTKCEMEYKLQTLGISKLIFFRPSMLLGPRQELRFGETIGKVIMQAFSFLFVGKFKRYKAVHAKTVAKAMIRAANDSSSKNIYESEEIQNLIS